MSKTLKTRPIAVRMADRKDRGVGIEEVHNHSDGKACDLPSLEDKVVYAHNVSYRDGNCYYQWAYTGVNVCGCNMCTDKVGRRKGARKNRHNAKVKLSRVPQGDDIDDVVFADKYTDY